MLSFDELTLDQIKLGYIESNDELICIFCEKKYKVGQIYKIGENLYDAHTAVKQHMIDEHNHVLGELLELDKKSLSMSDVQKRMISYFASKKTDKEIAEITHTTLSTVRQQRYQLKEKARQAKVFLAICELSDDVRDFKAYIDIHQSATMVDDRYLTTLKEEHDILDKLFDSLEPLKLNRLPSKQKQKVVVLKRISEQFDIDKEYTEKEINEIIESIYDDYVTIRRYMIEYGFLKRTNDGTTYWKP